MCCKDYFGYLTLRDTSMISRLTLRDNLDDLSLKAAKVGPF